MSRPIADVQVPVKIAIGGCHLEMVILCTPDYAERLSSMDGNEMAETVLQNCWRGRGRRIDRIEEVTS